MNDIQKAKEEIHKNGWESVADKALASRNFEEKHILRTALAEYGAERVELGQRCAAWDIFGRLAMQDGIEAADALENACIGRSSKVAFEVIRGLSLACHTTT